MSLTQLSATGQISWQIQKSNTPFQPTKQGQDSRSFSLPTPAGATSMYIAQLSIASGANVDVNFNSFTDLAGNAVTATKIYGIIVIVDIGDLNAAGIISIRTSVTHPLTGWIFTATAIPIPSSLGGDGGLIQVQAQAVVMSGTVNSLNFAATGGGTTTVDVVAIVGA